MNILETIIAQKRIEIAALDAMTLRRAAQSFPAPRDFLAAIAPRLKGEGPGAGSPRFGTHPSLISELKRASPSKGLLAPHLDLFQVADIYVQNGASAISVLTDEKFFQGKLETLRTLRSDPRIPIPLLRKDFIIDETQIYEARANGADAILLIAAALPDDRRLADLHACALGLGLTALIEVHNEVETERALKIPNIKLIGINNRNLATFEVTLETTEKLRPLIPNEIAVVAESGIFTAGDVGRLAKAKVDAILVGEALVTSDDIPAKVRELSGVPLSEAQVLGTAERVFRSKAAQRDLPASLTKIKICGIKTLKEARAAVEAGADYLGFNFYRQSVRFVGIEKCAEITAVMKKEFPDIKLVGVFVNSAPEEVRNILEVCSLDLAQLHGDETPELFHQLAPHAFRAFRGIPESIAGYERSEAPVVLIDAAVKGIYGGSGVTADWSAAAALARKYPLLLAGGLTPENVEEALRQVRPWGVDVASGVESAPGEKDAAKMAAFVKAVREVEN
ncbi:MAG TPA: indole-3-glycerol phosphate synthase TrpC [Anaerolineales bacterium]|nr:indole-3-glycerol phosphate synthase TrpC [Anaerolineales bacterium]